MVKFSLTSTALGLLASSLTLAADPPYPTVEKFIHAEDKVDSVAACLVSAANPQPGINACLCAVTNNAFGMCEEDAGNSIVGTFGIHSSFSGSWAAALQTEETELSATMPDDAGTQIVMNAYGSCGLTNASFELALGDLSATSKSRLKGILGAKASYSAVYMFPVKSGPDDNGAWVPAGDPVRLCSYGTASAIVAGAMYNRHHHSDRYGDYGERSHHKPFGLTATVSAQDLGITGAFEWVVENYDAAAGANKFGIQYVMVAGVADAVLQANTRNRLDAIGVVANARITDRALHLRRAIFAEVVDADPSAPPP